jgi:hypothetical protein
MFLFYNPSLNGVWRHHIGGWHLHRRNGYWFLEKRLERTEKEGARSCLAEFSGRIGASAWCIYDREIPVDGGGCKNIKWEEKMLAGTSSPFLLQEKDSQFGFLGHKTRIR